MRLFHDDAKQYRESLKILTSRAAEFFIAAEARGSILFLLITRSVGFLDACLFIDTTNQQVA